MSRPYRSVLYIPAANQRAMEKARTLAADAIIFDLEDAVAPAEKAGARGLLKSAQVTQVEVMDPGILRDIDTPADL